MLSRYFASAPAYRFFHTPMHRRDRRKTPLGKINGYLTEKGRRLLFFGRRFEKPLALGIGQDAAMQQPLAIVIGLVAQLPLVLIVLPSLLVLYASQHRANLQHDNVEATANALELIRNR